MAFYYVKNGGSATGDGGRATTKRTGTWNASASTYYSILEDALNATTAPTAGDLILWSEQSFTAPTSDSNPVVPDGVSIITVDDANQDQYKNAAFYLANPTAAYHYAIEMGAVAAMPSLKMGVHVTTGDGHATSIAEFGAEILGYSFDSTLDFDSASSKTYYLGTNYGTVALYDNAKFEATNYANQLLVLQGGNNFTFFGGSFVGMAQAIRVGLRGGYVRFYGTDFSGMDTNPDLVAFQGSEGGGSAYFYRCPLAANWSVTGETIGQFYVAIIESCDSEYQYEVYTRNGEVSFITTHHHADDGNLSDGTSKGSYHFQPNTNVSSTDPIMLGHAVEPRFLVAENTESATKTKARIKFATATADTLDTASIVVFLLYPDATNEYEWKSTRHYVCPLESGSALSTQTSKWTGTGADNEYYLDVTMTSPGDGLVAAMVGFCEDKDVYLSPEIEFVA